jgi:glycosyltransferase involved in cell wall biosynthesis
VVTGSNHARLDIATEFDLDPAQITIVGNGLPEDWHPHAPEEVDRRLSRLGIADRPYLLAVGNGKPHKNLPWLVQHADKWLQSQHLPHRIVLTNASAALVELSERVHITGHLNDGDHRAVYQGAAAVVFPSRHEGFGLPVIEAQALRTPVACSNAASLPEVSGGPGCAALFDPASPEELHRALARVLDPSEQSDLLDNGEANAALYTWDRVAERVLWVWEKHL